MVTINNLSSVDHKRVRLIPVSAAIADISQSQGAIGMDGGDVIFCLSPAEGEITAHYDSFYQTMTVTGPNGLAVSTFDPDGNVLGSGTITDGTVTYPLDEGMLPGGTVLATKSATSNIVNHSLVASFYVASDVVGQNVEFMVLRDLNLGWMNGVEGFDENLAPNAVGEMIVEYSSGEQHVVNIADYAGTNDLIVDEFGHGVFDKRANPAKTGLVSAKVRFRNLNDQIYLWVAQATHIYKFFDDGVSNVGYSLTSRDSRPYVQLKQIPSTLPASVRNLNCMFWGDTPVSSDNLSLDGDYLFASADVEANLANWDVSNVESMVDTFAYAKYHSLPIGNWTPTNLKYLVDTFAYAFADTAINWNTPALINTKYAFEGSGFSGSLYLDMSNVTNADCMFIDNTVFSQDLSQWCVPLLTSAPEDFNRDGILTPDQLPVWGTCPRGENIPDSDFTKVTYIKTDTSDPVWVEAEYAPENTNGELHIDWGDGAKEVLNVADFEANGYYLYLEHEYAVNGEYVVKVYSTTKANYTGFGEITKVTDWGSPANLQPYFDSDNLIEVPNTLHPALTSLQSMFGGCTSFNQDISMWDTANVTNMKYMFYKAEAFNQDISSWDVSNVTNMSSMFQMAVNFNKSIGSWNVSNVTDMSYMFHDARVFNQPLNNWNTSNVTNMFGMFWSATSFNQDISSWDVSNVTDMYGMFDGATAFNSPLNSWNVSKLTNAALMFRRASAFNQPLDAWNTSNIIYMNNMFQDAISFNQDLSQWCVDTSAGLPSEFDTNTPSWTLPRPVWGTCPRGENEPDGDAVEMGLAKDYSGTGWYKATDTGTVFNKGVPALETHVFSDSPIEYVSVHTKEDALLYGERAAVSNITDMSSLFSGHPGFNEDISSWDVSNVTNMSLMFYGATTFNQDLSSWDVSNVTVMNHMFFNANAFNSDISSWNTSSVTTMANMFNKASSFNSDISSWDVSSVTDMSRMFYNAQAFNQDLSQWCVSLIPTTPNNFYAAATAWTLPQPVWGTCPV